jgi:hypothetical protein
MRSFFYICRRKRHGYLRIASNAKKTTSPELNCDFDENNKLPFNDFDIWIFGL